MRNCLYQMGYLKSMSEHVGFVLNVFDDEEEDDNNSHITTSSFHISSLECSSKIHSFSNSLHYSFPW